MLGFGDFESSPCLCFERALVGPVANIGPVYGDVSDGNDDVEDVMVGIYFWDEVLWGNCILFGDLKVKLEIFFGFLGSSLVMLE